MGKSVFRKDRQKTYSWVKETTDKSKAFFRCCNKDIDIACMDESLYDLDLLGIHVEARLILVPCSERNKYEKVGILLPNSP